MYNRTKHAECVSSGLAEMKSIKYVPKTLKMELPYSFFGKRGRYIKYRTRRDGRMAGLNFTNRGQNLRIDSSNVGMESARSQTSVTAVGVNTATQGSVKLQQGTFGNLLTGWAAMPGLQKDDTDVMSGLRYARSENYSVKDVSGSGRIEVLRRVRHECLTYLLDLFLGHKKQGGMTEDGYIYGAQSSVTRQSGAPLYLHEVNALVAFPVQGSPLDLRYFHSETETTAFETMGKVVTKDGREIQFDLSLSMSRSFMEYYEEHYEMPDTKLCDPLVINLNTDMAALSDQKFTFDLDNDGILDRISVLEKGSGYLALDRNGDGRIGDGSELFGTATGNGFSELAAYDDDRDGWIDEDDEIFDKLLIWTKDENGRDVLYHLKDAGVGAICLNNVSTEFSLKDTKTNQTNGVIRRTGVFLFEDGTAGTVQHIDVAK